MNRGLWFLAVALTASVAFGANLPVKRFALFIGANQGGPQTQPLLYAQKDALKMQQVMQDVGGVTVADRMLLLDPTPEDVRAALVTLGTRISASAGTDTRRTEFLFYYSGHSDEEGLLLGEQSLSYKTLRDGLQAVPADVRIAILDSCSSGAFARLKGGVQKAPFLGQDSSQMKGHAFLTSSSETEASQESDTLQGSFFTHYLVSGLRGGADRVGDGLITLNEAYEYAFQNTLSRTESTRAGPQHPSYEIQLSGTGNLILSDVKATNARLEVAPDVAGKLYVRNQTGQLFAEVTKEAGSPLQLAFPAGTYTVTAVTPQKSLSTKVVLTAQGPTSVASRDFQAQDLARFAVRGPARDAEPAPEAPLDATPFSLGLVPGLPGSGWGGADKTMAVSALVDLARNVQGIQAAGLVSLNGETLDGFQASGIGSVSQGSVRGFQSSGVFNIAASGMKGLQFGGVFNIAAGEDNGYWQSAGVFNLARGTFRGIQSAGVVNIADKFDGIQWATVNVAGDLRGIQGAVVNVAGEVRGVQLGLVNVNTHIDGFGIGLINVSPDAYYHPAILFLGSGDSHFVFQWGMGWLYWVAGMGGNPKTNLLDRETFGGVGVQVKNRNLFLDLDAGWDGQFHQTASNDTPDLVRQVPFGRATVGLQLGWLAVEAGALVTPDPTGSRFSVGPFDLQAKARWYTGLRFF
jgi:hypothetical protein